MSQDLAESARKCINTIAFHLFNINPTSGQNTQNGIDVLIESFEHALERLIRISNDTDVINAAFVNKILESSYHVSTNVTQTQKHTDHSHLIGIEPSYITSNPINN